MPLPEPHPPGWITGAVRVAGAASVWLIRRPFLARRAVWAVCALVLAVAAILLAADEMMFLAGVVLLAGLVSVAVLTHWTWLARGERPVVLITTFAGRSAAGRAAAESHVGALKLFLEADENLRAAGPITVRSLAVPVSERGATRLLRLERVLMVVRGTGDAGGDTSRWEGSVHFRADSPEVRLNRYALTTYTDRVEYPRLGRLLGRGVPGVTSASFDEGDVEMSRFFSSNISVDHFRQVAKIACLLLSEKQFEGAPNVAHSGTLLLPTPEDGDLSEELQARSLRLEAAVRMTRQDSRSLLTQLEERAWGNCVGGAAFAAWLTAQWFAGEQENWSTIHDTRRSIDRWRQRFPTDPWLLANSAGIAIREQDLERARREIARGEQAGVPHTTLERLRGNIAWEEQRPRDALDHYRRAAVARGVLRWQIGDCLAALGRVRAALREYRAALRIDSYRVPAAVHARALEGWGTLLPTYPSGWRNVLWRLLNRAPRISRSPLRLWRFLRPEDPYLPPMLARHALVVGDIRRANEWGTYAITFAGSNRLIALVDQVVVLALMADPQTDEMAGFLERHIEWLESQGLVRPKADARAALALLLRSSRAVRRQPETTRAIELLAAIGVAESDVTVPHPAA